jgi:GNAT superfamily N-acetyltransferase
VHDASSTPRLLTEKDVPAAMELSTEAGWNQTPEDWRMLIQLEPEGCFGIEVEGKLVATTTLLCYGRTLAWVGMVLTRIEWRGRGFARRLLSTALARAEQLGIATVKLDATQQGQPVYEKLGFRGEQLVERWHRDGSSKAVEKTTAAQQKPGGTYLDLDSQAFGADRSRLLSELEKRSAISSTAEAYLFSRPGRVSDYIGPCVAKNRDGAQTLISSRVRESSKSWFWDVLSQNQEAISLAQELGFKPQRQLLRMVRGKEFNVRDSLIYAIAGFELG